MKFLVVTKKLLQKNLDIVIDYYVCGGIEELIDKINYFKIKPDLICSFNVLEHIYDLERWLKAFFLNTSEIATEWKV